ncbi:uncharacterized protein LOC134207117 [Armigeres subalbatus]|uniref:uncharacterized protein LOC134207117 n=1 Tax=Armigeres subalbatus TaxID=124917 RepID=UPI002ED5C49D
MDCNCCQCSKQIKTLEFMQCSGFCDQAAHLECVGLKRPNMDFVNEQRNILWFCDNCVDQLKTIKDNFSISSNEIITSVSEIKESLAELKNDLLETKALTKSFASKVNLKDSSGTAQVRSAWPSIKRPRGFDARETPKSRPDAKLIVGTKSIEKEQFAVETVAKPPEKFWIYLSRIASHVTESDIQELVKGCLPNTESIDVRKLVRKDADLKQFAFISFKVGVDVQEKEYALDPSVWPKGIYFREFKNLQTERDFWGPAKIPRIDDRTQLTDVTPMIVTTTPAQ